jgi:protoheme IX farnesyltransferase
MMSEHDAEGSTTFRRAALDAAALLPISLAPVLLAMAGWLYFLVALSLSGALLALAVASARAPTPLKARRLFLGTLAYLPALLGALVAGAIR